MKSTIMTAATIAILASLLGCRDGLLEPPVDIEPTDAGSEDALFEPDASYCDPFVFIIPDSDGAYETRGMLVNLIAMQATGLLDDGYSIETAVDSAATTVLGRFPTKALPRVEPVLSAAKADALEFLSRTNAP